jgi:hypothetical protein
MKLTQTVEKKQLLSKNWKAEWKKLEVNKEK